MIFSCAVGGQQTAPSLKFSTQIKTRKPCCRKETDNAAAVLFGLQFTDNTHYKSKSSQASKAIFRAPTYRHKTELNAKWPSKVIQGHLFWSLWKGDEGLSNTKYLLRFRQCSVYKRSAVLAQIPNILRITVHFHTSPLVI